MRACPFCQGIKAEHCLPCLLVAERVMGASCCSEPESKSPADLC